MENKKSVKYLNLKSLPYDFCRCVNVNCPLHKLQTCLRAIPVKDSPVNYISYTDFNNMSEDPSTCEFVIFRSDGEADD